MLEEILEQVKSKANDLLPKEKSATFTGITGADEDVEHMILDATINDLSDKDIEFLIAMLQDEERSKTVDIAARMNVSSSYAGQYKRRLVKLGIIVDSGKGRIEFAFPLFKEKLKERYLPE